MNLVISERLAETDKQTRLDNLWGVLKDKYRTSPRRYSPVGLTEVTFDIPMDLFREECERKMQDHVPWVNYAMITPNLEDCFDFFLGKRILSYGLCCAAEFKSPINTAVSIYLMGHPKSPREKNHEKSCLILPRVNFVPTIENILDWRDKGRVDSQEYKQWLELVDRFKSSCFYRG